VALLIPILVYQSMMPKLYLTGRSIILITTGLIISTIGIMITIIAFRYYDIREFLGLRQLEDRNYNSDFQKYGLLSYVRHPLYSGSILAVTGYFIFAPTLTNLILGISVTVYFLIGIHFEEKKLIRDFGEKYREYKKNVPSLIPRFKRF
jgi:protein-S-isoprenylcysteine O-methyltransferase Ste14